MHIYTWHLFQCSYSYSTWHKKREGMWWIWCFLISITWSTHPYFSDQVNFICFVRETTIYIVSFEDIINRCYRDLQVIWVNNGEDDRKSDVEHLNTRMQLKFACCVVSGASSSREYHVWIQASHYSTFVVSNHACECYFFY